jgi:hypothetical protein
MQELIRHVDPARRTLGRFFHEEIAEPLGIDFYIGLPSEVPDERLAQLRTFTARRSLRALPHTPAGYVLRILWPWSLLRGGDSKMRARQRMQGWSGRRGHGRMLLLHAWSSRTASDGDLIAP